MELSRGKDVMCCLPTGSGKTALAVFAAWQALIRGGRLIYTSPLKALSAQKRREFATIFGFEAVGLVTGDHCIIPDAPLVVMTTEILRNKLYPGKAPVFTEPELPLMVVLDELHWISDPSRGRAWEEIIINSPEWMQFLGLSGSVGGDPQKFCDWMSSIRCRACSLVRSQFRPVPLHFYMMMRSSGEPRRQRCFRLWSEKVDEHDEHVSQDVPEIHPKLQATREQAEPVWCDVAKDSTGGMDRVFALSKTIRRLQRMAWLPSLSFALRRQHCEEQVKLAFMMLSLGAFGGSPRRVRAASFRLPERLVSSKEAAEIQGAIDAFEKQFPDLCLSNITKAVMLAGLAAHHAGQMPAQRALVECLFERGLLKLIFATETLAAGIHMPARAVILSQLEKKDAFGLRWLNSTEVLQMCGRAGRRGLDLQGHAIVNGPVSWTAETLISGPLPLNSSFSPSYDMLCALFTGGREEHEVASLIQKSFAAFLASCDDEKSETDYLQEEGKLERLGQFLARVRQMLERSGCSLQEIKEYKKLRHQQDLDERLGFRGLRDQGHSDDDLDLFGDPEEELVMDQELQNKVHLLSNREELLTALDERSALASRLRKPRAAPGREPARYQWCCFQKYMAVLEHEGFLLSENTGPTRIVQTSLKGEAAHQITQGANILWLSSLLPQPGQDLATTYGLEPGDLAALVAAMSDGRGSDAEDVSSASLAEGELAELRDVLEWLTEYRWHLWEVQLGHGVYEAMPLSVEAFRVTKAWASGGSWQEVVATAAMAEGDVFRLLRRTLEILEGLELCQASAQEASGCSAGWQLRVQRAQEMLLRCPVAENQQVETGEFLPFDSS